ncbi:MAG: hypothetical protein ACM3NR_03165 [Methanosarcina sp.]
MEEFTDVLEKLNCSFNSESFETGKFNLMLAKFLQLTDVTVRMIDFVHFSPRRRAQMKRQKMKCVKIQLFEKAAEYRKLEKECTNYIEMKEICKIETSTFFYDGEFLWYFYLGNTLNDKKIRRLLKAKGMLSGDSQKTSLPE